MKEVTARGIVASSGHMAPNINCAWAGNYQSFTFGQQLVHPASVPRAHNASFRCSMLPLAQCRVDTDTLPELGMLMLLSLSSQSIFLSDLSRTAGVGHMGREDHVLVWNVRYRLS